MNLPIWYDAGGSHMLWYSVHVIRRPAGCSCTTCLVLAKLRLKCLLRRIFDSAAPLPPKKNAGRQSGGQRFARACAVEMHMDISEEQFNFAWKCTRKMPDPNPATHVLCEPAQSKCTWTFQNQKSHFVWKFTKAMPDANPAASILCEPAQSKCTWTFHKSHFVLKFTGKMPDAPETTWIKHRALTVTVRTSWVWPHCLGKYCMCIYIYADKYDVRTSKASLLT